MIIFDEGPTGVTDRVVGALLAFISSFVTILLFPTYLVLKFAFKFHLTHPYFLFKLGAASFSIFFFFWASLVSVVALAYGATNGTTSTITMLSHLWGTSSAPELTQKIWALVILGGVVTAVICAKLVNG